MTLEQAKTRVLMLMNEYSVRGAVTTGVIATAEKTAMFLTAADTVAKISGDV